MTLPVSGAISFNAINVELGVAGTTQASLNQASYRTLAGVPSGAISMSNFYGKTNAFSFTISADQTNANLRTLAVNAGWNQSIAVIATIGSGVRMSSNAVGTPGLTINGSWPGGVTLINNGTIVGRGGNGGGGTDYLSTGGAGTVGGLALSVSVAVTINNASGTIAGGGGGGGGGGGARGFFDGCNGVYIIAASGGGGGGGRSSLTNSSGGAGGTTAVVNGNTGAAGTISGAGGGGSGGVNGPFSGGAGGAGGNWGSSGSNGAAGTQAAASAGGAGGGAGAATSGSASYITWAATGTRFGTIG